MNFEDAHFLVRCLRYRFHTESLALKTLTLLDLKGATVVDVGANKGIYSFWLARAVERRRVTRKTVDQIVALSLSGGATVTF